MNPWHLVLAEIAHRKLAFVLGLLAVTAAVAVLVAQLTLIDAHDLVTARILEMKAAATRQEMRRLEDDYRKITKKLGFNLLILPADQSLSDYYAGGVMSRDMPESYVHTLARSGILTIRHLLPTLERRIEWPEQNGRRVILAGVRGEVPLALRQPGPAPKRAPIMTAVPPGKAVVGHALWSELGLERGETITVLGKAFEVDALRAERGNRDDVTIWVDLAQAQQMLAATDRITGILALKCECEGNELATIRADLARVLPGVQVIEVADKVVTRAEARARAHQAALEALQAEREHRDRMRREMASNAAVSGPFVVLIAAAWIGLLALINVRERRSEIGILRALGVSTFKLLVILLGRAKLLGLGGAILGIVIGLGVGLARSGLSVEGRTLLRIAGPLRLAVILCAAPAVAALASWIPVLLACRQDPADVLREE